MFVKKWMLTAALASLSVPALAAPEKYTLDSSHTYPSLEFPHMGLSVWRGKFNSSSGTFIYDQAKSKASIDVVVDTASIDFGHDEMNQHAVSADWLNVEKFPKMTYKGDLKFDGDKPTEVNGKLTLLGVTKPLKLKINSFTCLKEHPFYKIPVCGADAEGELNRADFGLDKYTDNGMGMLNLRIQVEALKK